MIEYFSLNSSKEHFKEVYRIEAVMGILKDEYSSYVYYGQFNKIRKIQGKIRFHKETHWYLKTIFIRTICAVYGFNRRGREVVTDILLEFSFGSLSFWCYYSLVPLNYQFESRFERDLCEYHFTLNNNDLFRFNPFTIRRKKNILCQKFF